jgi:hypothetical protein
LEAVSRGHKKFSGWFQHRDDKHQTFHGLPAMRLTPYQWTLSMDLINGPYQWTSLSSWTNEVLSRCREVHDWIEPGATEWWPDIRNVDIFPY